MNFESTNILFLTLLFIILILDFIVLFSSKFRKYNKVRVFLFFISLMLISIYISFLVTSSTIIKVQ